MISSILGDKTKFYLPQSSFQNRRHRSSAYEREVTSRDKYKACAGAVLGTLVPVAYMMRKQKVSNPLKLRYDLQDMVALSGFSVLGGVGLGMLGENKETNKNKFKEGVFQFLNASVPTWIVGGVLKLSELSRKFNNIPSKVGSVLLGLTVGMYGTATVSNLLFDPLDKKPDRKLKLKDCLVNMDDALGALVLAKFPLVEKLQVEKLLPAIYAYCGYRAGKSN